MTCRHAKGDPNCTSQKGTRAWHEQQDAYQRQNDQKQYTMGIAAGRRQAMAEIEAQTPDSERYEILDFIEIPGMLVVKAQYPNCSKCKYEGIKIMVFEGVSIRDMVFWRKIDPHFGNPDSRKKTEAPSPVARFPGNDQGWERAIMFCKFLNGVD